MSLFQCEACGCCENTALSSQGYTTLIDIFNWEGKEEYKGKKLCSECGPKYYTDGKPTGAGKWHGRFEKVLLPKGEFITNKEGNLEHKISGRTDIHNLSIGKRFN